MADVRTRFQNGLVEILEKHGVRKAYCNNWDGFRKYSMKIELPEYASPESAQELADYLYCDAYSHATIRVLVTDSPEYKLFYEDGVLIPTDRDRYHQMNFNRASEFLYLLEQKESLNLLDCYFAVSHASFMYALNNGFARLSSETSDKALEYVRKSNSTEEFVERIQELDMRNYGYDILHGKIQECLNSLKVC